MNPNCYSAIGFLLKPVLRKLVLLFLCVFFVQQIYAQPSISSTYPNVGRPGSQLNIYGQNFTAASSVTVGGVAVSSFIVYNEGLISAILGPGPNATVNIVVTTPTGTATLPGFDFQNVLNPEITGFAPINPTLGQTITITGLNFDNVTGVGFDFYVSSAYTIINSTTIETVYNGEDYHQFLVVTNSVDTSVFFGNTPPIINSVSPSSGTSGTLVTFTGESVNYIYSVKFGNSPAFSITQVDEHTFTAVVGEGASGDIQIRTHIGTVIVNNGFTFIQPAPPAVAPSGANPVSGSIVQEVTVDPEVQIHNNAPYVQRHYDIEPQINPATSTATLTLYYLQEDFNNFNASPTHGADLPTGPGDNAGISNFRIYQYHGTSVLGVPGSYESNGIEINPDDDKIIWNATNKVWEVTFNVTGFSGFFASSANATLPLTLVSFAGQLKNKQAILKWETSDEINVSRFEIQRSIDGSTFEKINYVSAAENTSGNRTYSYADNIGSAPVYYYRLKTIDKDDSYSFSKVVALKPDNVNARSLGIYPNPAKDVLTLTHPLSNQTTQYKLIDFNGRIIKTGIIVPGSVQTKINVSNLPAGNYKLIWSDGTTSLHQSVLIQ